MDSKSSTNVKLTKKILRKQNRCKNILKKHENVDTVDTPTKYVFVGNGGLICGVQREMLMEVFSSYGQVKDIVMVPDKPYSFVVYKDEKESELAVKALQGQKLKPEIESVLYLCYVRVLPQKTNAQLTFPPGLIMIKDFVSEEEEQILLNLINFDSENAMKHRKVKHFGYEFCYSNNNVDRNKPLKDQIPDSCYQHLQKLMELGHISRIPNQLTVNRYLPGQGIPPHIDTHSAFEDEIISLSLGSQVIMDFYHPSKEHISVLLPRRSVIIMTGESRYLWKHGITPRKTDVISVFGEIDYLTLSYREPRTSFTFRSVRQMPCNCAFPEQCDSQKPRLKLDDTITEREAHKLEKQYVTEVYENIADHFSETRFKPWPLVQKFINEIPYGSIMIDAGCGNGKNMGENTNSFTVGCDISMNLAKVCMERKLQVVVGDMLNLPFRDKCADVCICIAVIHHMASEKRRLAAVKEIFRILRPGGLCLIYVWALEQETSVDGPSNYLSYSKTARKKETVLSENENSGEDDLTKLIPVHNNRTPFENQDILVPWHKKSNSATSSTKDVYKRFYHVFKRGELEALISDNNALIKNSYYDKGNWCVIFEKCKNV